MAIGNTHTVDPDTKRPFETVLIKYIANTRDFKNSYNKLAEYLSNESGKSIDGRKITFMARGEAYAKKWLMSLLLKTALQFGWLPESRMDWEDVVWVLSGKRQSILGGSNEALFKQLADITDKPEVVFETRFCQMMEASHGQSY